MAAGDITFNVSSDEIIGKIAAEKSKIEIQLYSTQAALKAAIEQNQALKAQLAKYQADENPPA